MAKTQWPWLTDTQLDTMIKATGLNFAGVPIIDVDALKSQISSAEEAYKDAFTSDEYMKVMNDLLNIKMPKKLWGRFVPAPGVLSPKVKLSVLRVTCELGSTCR